jgi:hypothetical protein
MNVVHQLALGEIREKEKKVNFAIVFYLLKEGCPLMDYGYLKDLFSFLKSKTCPKNLGLKANWIGTLQNACIMQFGNT